MSNKKDWIDNEYDRIVLMNSNKGNDIVLINGDKQIKRKDLTDFFTNEEVNNLSIMEETVIPFNVGKEFHNEWNKKDMWSDL